jgi:hypothetical protein
MSYLISNYSIDKIQISKPKKHGEYLVSKVKYPLGSPESPESLESLVIQLPKMKIVTIGNKNIELEFLENKSKYNKEVYDFLSELDDFIINFVGSNSEEWFGKKIPLDSIKQMYNKFIKAPKNSMLNCTMNFTLPAISKLLDSSFKEGDILECISQMKYIVFSKDTCFAIWELCNVKKCATKIIKVSQFGFIENPEDDNHPESEDDNLPEDYSFF